MGAGAILGGSCNQGVVIDWCKTHGPSRPSQGCLACVGGCKRENMSLHMPFSVRSRCAGRAIQSGGWVGPGWTFTLAAPLLQDASMRMNSMSSVYFVLWLLWWVEGTGPQPQSPLHALSWERSQCCCGVAAGGPALFSWLQALAHVHASAIKHLPA